VTPTLFVLLKSTGEIPKTSSGKIMRHQLLENYLAGQFASQCIYPLRWPRASFAGGRRACGWR
jgi:bacillopeptidase F (M6 metalloprotease family)